MIPFKDFVLFVPVIIKANETCWNVRATLQAAAAAEAA